VANPSVAFDRCRDILPGNEASHDSFHAFADDLHIMGQSFAYDLTDDRGG